MSRFLLRRGLHTTWFGHFCYQTCRLGTIILWIQGRFFHGFLLGWASISPVPLFDAVPTSYGFNLHFEFPSFHVQILPFFTITSSQLVESPTFLWWIRRFLWISHQVKSPFCLWHPHFWLLKSHEDFPLTLAKLQFWLNSQASYVKSWFLRQSRIFATKSSPSEWNHPGFCKIQHVCHVWVPFHSPFFHPGVLHGLRPGCGALRRGVNLRPPARHVSSTLGNLSPRGAVGISRCGPWRSKIQETSMKLVDFT